MDTALKQRLVGASVLIALAVVILPMLLGGRPDSEVQETQKIEISRQPPDLDFETRRYPLGQQAPDRDAQVNPAPAIALPVPEQAPPPATQNGSDERVTQEQVEENPQDSAPALDEPVADTLAGEQLAPQDIPVEAAPAPVIEPAAAADEGGRYVVQVASFGAVNNANRLSKTLGGYGYSVMVDTIKSDVGTLHRVRVGPYASESEANGAVSKLQTQVKDIKPRVMDLQPGKAAQVTQPSDPLVRWVVQVGSFSNAQNADRLVAQLRLESLTAYKEQVSSSGSTAYRVRVGPFLEREEAIRVDKLINERLSIDGVVMSAD
jgi:DedD protein